MTRQGYRDFVCEDCGYKWTEPTRDCHSPSGDCCPECGAWNTPEDSHEDPDLPVDRFGNLL